MGDLALVRGRERVGEGRGHVEELRHRHSARRNHLVERPALDELHRQEADGRLP